MNHEPRYHERGMVSARTAFAVATLVMCIGAGRLGIERADHLSAEQHQDDPVAAASINPEVSIPSSLPDTESPEGVELPSMTPSVSETPQSTLVPAPTETPLPTEPIPSVATVPPVTESIAPLPTEVPPVVVPESPTPVVEGQLAVNAPIGGPVNGVVTMAAANIRSEDTFAANLRIIASNKPDFIALSEVSTEPLTLMEASAPGYSAYRDSTIDPSSDSRNDLANAIMWREKDWEMLDAGREKITKHDYLVYDGKHADWNRYAVWGVFQRESDGAIVSVIATHMMTNPVKNPNQWRKTNPPMTRVEQYVDSTHNVIEIAGELATYGPVLSGGDMNSHPDEGNWTAAEQMQKNGYDYTVATGEVIYIFNQQGTKVIDSKDIMLDLHGDHENKSVQTKIDMNGVGPTPPEVS